MSVYSFALAALLVALSVTDVSAACDFSAATACLDGQTSLPDNPNLQQCRNVLEAIGPALNCVLDVISVCDETEQATAIVTMEAAQTVINTRCGGKAEIQCEEVGFKYPQYENCFVDVQVDELVTTVLDQWNRNQLSGDSSECGALATAHLCWEVQARNCQVLIAEQLGQLYDDIPNLKQAVEICRREVEVYPPMTPCSENDKATRRREVLDNCALVADYSSFGVAPVCVAMQHQIDCILQRSAGCPEVADEFIRPRVHSYGMANEKFCGNMTIGGVAIRSTDRDCNYDSLYGCYVNTFLSSFEGSHLTFNKDSFKRLLRFYEWDEADECSAFRFSNFTHIRVCEKSVEFSCMFPLPLSPLPLFAPSLDAYESTLYANLDQGPLPINRYGAYYLQYKGNMVCFPDCTDYANLDATFTPCLGQMTTTGGELAELPEDDDSTSLCSELTTAVSCVSGVTRSCPIFLARTEETLNADTVAQAVARCNVSLDIYPEDYGTTVPASTLYPPTGSTSTTRTYSTTTNPNPSTTADAAIQGCSSVMVSHVIVAMATIVSVTTALSTRW